LSDGSLRVYNTDNDIRKMSRKYSAIFDKIQDKCKLLKGKSVQIRTSQNTGAWSVSTWFSDISLSDTDVKNTDRSAESVEEIEDLKAKIKKKDLEINEIKLEKKQAVEEVDSLTEKVSESKKIIRNVTDRAENYQEQYNIEVVKNIENEKVISDLKVEFDQFEDSEKIKIEQMSKELDAMDIVNTKRDCTIRGHALKLLALRIGIVHEPYKGRINMLIKQHVRKNYYRVALTDYDDREVVMAIGFDKNTFFVATVESENSKIFRETLERIYGKSEADLKSSSDSYSLINLKEMYDKVMSEIHG
jgi:hypothetical protein